MMIMTHLTLNPYVAIELLRIHNLSVHAVSSLMVNRFSAGNAAPRLEPLLPRPSASLAVPGWQAGDSILRIPRACVNNS
jgi:hypothetical protein